MSPLIIFTIALSMTACSQNISMGNGKTTLASIEFPKEPPKEKLYDRTVEDNEKQWGTLNVHDPSIYKDGDWYYVFSTDVRVGGTPTPGIQVRKSKDLLNWQWVGYAFNGIPKEAEEWTQATNLWAPDVTKIGDTYYLYYAASRFGTNQSFIGVATSKSIEGPWEDKGLVIKSQQGDEWNTIDPNVVRDDEGNLWLDFGSFFGGIYIVRLDQNTGKVLENSKPTLIARRSREVQSAVEGPYIIYNSNQKKYYLFVSYDSLFSDYNVRVGRSDKINGPYLDYNGNKLTDINASPYDIGNKILGGYKFGDRPGWIAPGHNSVLKDGNNYFIVHHARGEQDNNWPYLHVRKILWSDDGWPMVSPERYAGEKEQKIEKDNITGDWQVIVLEKNDNSQLESKNIKLLGNGKIDDNNSKSYWEFSGDNTLKLFFYDTSVKGNYLTYKAKVMPSWDWEIWNTTLVLTGIDQKGVAIWGKKVQ